MSRFALNDAGCPVLLPDAATVTAEAQAAIRARLDTVRGRAPEYLPDTLLGQLEGVRAAMDQVGLLPIPLMLQFQVVERLIEGIQEELATREVLGEDEAIREQFEGGPA